MSLLSWATFATGAAIGLAVAMPIGPMGVLCIHRTVVYGFMGGLATGLAAATVQMTYGLVAALGAGPTNWILLAIGKEPLAALSAAALFWFGFRVLRQKLCLPKLARGAAADLRRSFGEALAFGFANPLTLVLFFAAFPVLSTPDDVVRAPMLISGVFAGVIGWYVLLSTAVAALRERLSAGSLNLVNQAAGLMLLGLGLLMIPDVLGRG